MNSDVPDTEQMKPKTSDIPFNRTNFRSFETTDFAGLIKMVFVNQQIIEHSAIQPTQITLFGNLLAASGCHLKIEQCDNIIHYPDEIAQSEAMFSVST